MALTQIDRAHTVHISTLFMEKSRLCFIISNPAHTPPIPACVCSPVCSLFGKITQIYGRDANNILSYCKRQMNKSPCQDASAPLPGDISMIFLCVCLCTLIHASAQACICEFVYFILKVLWSCHLKAFLVRFIQLIAVGFQWPDQVGEMQSVVKLNCSKI